MASSDNKFRSDHPSKYAAQTKVGNALRDGKIQKPDRCSRCGRLETELKEQGLRIEAHHFSYEEKDWLNVLWYCNPCHAAVHVQLEQDKANGREPDDKPEYSTKRIRHNPPPALFLEAAKVWAEMESGIHGDPKEWEEPPADSKAREKWALELREKVPGLTSPGPVSHKQILKEVGWPEDTQLPGKPLDWMVSPEFKSVVTQYRKYQAALALPESYKISSFLRPLANELSMLMFARVKQSQLGIGRPMPDSVIFGEGWKVIRALGETDGEIKQAGVNINIQNFELLPEEARKEALSAYFANAQAQAEQQLLEAEGEILDAEVEDD